MAGAQRQAPRAAHWGCRTALASGRSPRISRLRKLAETHRKTPRIIEQFEAIEAENGWAFFDAGAAERVRLAHRAPHADGTSPPGSKATQPS